MAATRSIVLTTEIPGPRSRAIGERIERSIARPLDITFPIVAHSARGVTLTDVDGNTFIDFAGGVGCLTVGHSHPEVVAAAQEQLDRFAHTDFTIVAYERYVELAERLTERAPISGPVKAAFFNAGTEAVENAVKFARAYTGRPAVIAFEGGFHGRTLLSLSLTSKVHPYKAGLGPFAPEIYRVPFPNEYRGVSSEAALAALERAFTTAVAAGDRRRDRPRAGSGRGRLHRRAARVRRRSPRPLRRPRDRARRRRGADRVRPHRPLLRDRARRRRAGPDLRRQVDRERAAALRRPRPRRDHGRARHAAASAGPTSAIRSRWRRRSPCST